MVMARPVTIIHLRLSINLLLSSTTCVFIHEALQKVGRLQLIGRFDFGLKASTTALQSEPANHSLFFIILCEGPGFKKGDGFRSECIGGACCSGFVREERDLIADYYMAKVRGVGRRHKIAACIPWDIGVLLVFDFETATRAVLIPF